MFKKSSFFVFMVIVLFGLTGCVAEKQKSIFKGKELAGIEGVYSSFSELGQRESWTITLANQGNILHECSVVLNSEFSVDLVDILVPTSPISGIKEPYGKDVFAQGDSIKIMDTSDFSHASAFVNDQGQKYPVSSPPEKLTIICEEGEDFWQLH